MKQKSKQSLRGDFKHEGGKKRKKQTDESHKANLFTGNKFFFFFSRFKLLFLLLFSTNTQRETQRENE